ncbi:hypothetical protein [Estrella lausannensis]|uniref:Uncharacterized protein n=1 Tax=Estrella lausannensis TaxID=483423 RepID=A0A0H5E7G0_9BACT|nr:hypothetical protein [Estrella lausannensis]CRX39275.1 Conserved hypothetical protein [Estrella lausannensis]
MGKTNFTKVEESLAQGLHKMEVERLLNEADKASGKPPPPKKETSPELAEEKKKLIKDLELNINRLKAKDSKIFEKLKVKRSTVQKFTENPQKLSEEDWKHAAILLKRTETLLKEMVPDKANDKLVEDEQTRHLNKRFNVNEKWLPLN